MRHEATVYQRKGSYFVSAYDRTDAGFWIASAHWSLPVTAALEELGHVVVEALASRGTKGRHLRGRTGFTDLLDRTVSVTMDPGVGAPKANEG